MQYMSPENIPAIYIICNQVHNFQINKIHICYSNFIFCTQKFITIHIVVNLDLFVSGSVFRDGTNYPPKSNVRTLLRQSSSQRQPGQTSSSLFLYFPYLYLRPGSWFRYIVYSYIIYNYPYLLARVLF